MTLTSMALTPMTLTPMTLTPMTLKGKTAIVDRAIVLVLPDAGMMRGSPGL